MGRKIIDIWPTLAVTPNFGTLTAMADAELMAEGMRRQIHASFGHRNYDIEVSFAEDARCEHCNHAWTEQGSDYNGGCCSKDEANDPDRLGVIRSLADDVDGHDFYILDEGRPSRLVISWPDTLATAVLAWLDAGRPAESVPQLLPVAHRVNNEEWCTIWSDPGPSGCSLARLPDEVRPCSSPEELAEQLISLIDDMGLTPARQAAA